MVHTFSALGYQIAVDVNSGAVHLLDDASFRILGLAEGPLGEALPESLRRALPDYTREELEEAWRELLELQG